MSESLVARLRGSMTALATPFKHDQVQAIDEKLFAEFAAWQVAQGTRGLVPCGPTGEGPTLSLPERDRLIRISVEAAAGKAVVIAATGTNGTDGTIALTRAAKAAGADAALVVVPYYNKPTQRGIVAHFEAVARAVDLPLLVHNVPGRTGLDLAPETLSKLDAAPTIVGILDESGDPNRPLATALAAGHPLLQLCGCDSLAVPFNLAGGRGCISAVANVAPRMCADLQGACASADWGRAWNIHVSLAPLVEALGRETDPAPVK